MNTASDMCLEELEGVVWQDPASDSHLVDTCHQLRKKPISEFTVEDLRIMIGQNLSSDILIPVALHHLSIDPLIGGDLYDGDLISVVSQLPSAYWGKNPEQYEEFQKIATIAIERLHSESQPDRHLISILEVAASEKIEGEQAAPRNH